MGMTREIALHCMKSASELERELCEECPIYGQTGCDHCFEDALQYVIGMLEQEPILYKIFCIVHPLSIMSTPELEHKAIMQIAEMLEPLCLPESEDKE